MYNREKIEMIDYVHPGSVILEEEIGKATEQASVVLSWCYCC